MKISEHTSLEYGSGIYFLGLSWGGSPATYFQKILSEMFQEKSKRFLEDMLQTNITTNPATFAGIKCSVQKYVENSV